jgi:hypothetical protein
MLREWGTCPSNPSPQSRGQCRAPAASQGSRTTPPAREGRSRAKHPAHVSCVRAEPARARGRSPLRAAQCARAGERRAAPRWQSCSSSRGAPASEVSRRTAARLSPGATPVVCTGSHKRSDVDIRAGVEQQLHRCFVAEAHCGVQGSPTRLQTNTNAVGVRILTPRHNAGRRVRTSVQVLTSALCLRSRLTVSLLPTTDAAYSSEKPCSDMPSM